MKRILAVALCIITVCLLTSCQCKHDWISATCTTAMTCKKCSTTQGQSLGHTWIDATCTESKRCSVCEKVDGNPLGHKWADATIDTPQICMRCEETQGDKLSHDALDANESLHSLSFSYPVGWIKTEISSPEGFRFYPYGSQNSGIMMVSYQEMSGNYGHSFLANRSDVNNFLGAVADGIAGTSCTKEYLTLQSCPAARIKLSMSIGGLSYETLGYLLLTKESGNKVGLYSFLMAEPINLSDRSLTTFEAIIEEIALN